MQQHPGVCSSIAPQFSFSWEPHFNALITGLLSNHDHKKMQEAEELTILSPFESSSLCFKSSNKTALTKTLNSFMCLKIHVHTQKPSSLLPCLPKEVQRSFSIQTHGLHLAWALWELHSGDSTGRQRKDCPKCSFWPNSSTYII